MFLKGRWWRELEHAREVSRAASKNRSVKQSQHCNTSSCFQRGQVEEQERVFFRETADSSQYGAGRVAHRSCAILHKRGYLRFVHLDQPRDIMEAPGPEDGGQLPKGLTYRLPHTQVRPEFTVECDTEQFG